MPSQSIHRLLTGVVVALLLSTASPLAADTPVLEEQLVADMWSRSNVKPNEAPPTPTLIYPLNGAVLNTLIPNWEVHTAIATGVLYSPQIQYSRDPSFMSLDQWWTLCGTTGITARFKPMDNLRPGAVYYWRARASYGNACGASNAEWSPWTSVAQVTTPDDPTIPPAPKLVSPGNGRLVLDRQPELLWELVPGEAGFWVGIDRSDGKKFGGSNRDSTATSFRPRTPLELATYTWYVGIRTEYAWGHTSEPWSFELVDGTQATFGPDAEVQLQYTASDGAVTTLHAPVGALTDTTRLVLGATAPKTTASYGRWAKRGFTVEAYSGGGLFIPNFVFASPAMATVDYIDIDFWGLKEPQLRLAFWDGSVWADAGTNCNPPVAVDWNANENWVSVPVCRLGQYALFAPIDNPVYLPLMQR